MALSGSKDYISTYTASSLIALALRRLGVYDPSETIDTTEQTNALEVLNLIVKELSAQTDLWLREEQTLFLVAGQERYLLGATTSDHFTANLIETTSVSGSGTSLTVASDTGISSGDNIGIKLDDGTVQWTTVNGAPSNDVITLTASLTGEIEDDGPVYTYTSKAYRPNKILIAFTRDTSNVDNEITQIGRMEYSGLSMKQMVGRPNQFHYNPLITNGELFVWPSTSDSAVDKIVMISQLNADDLDSVSNNLQFPPEWHNALGWQLAAEMAAEYGLSEPEQRRLWQLAGLKVQNALDNDIENSSVIFEIGC